MLVCVCAFTRCWRQYALEKALLSLIAAPGWGPINASNHLLNKSSFILTALVVDVMGWFHFQGLQYLTLTNKHLYKFFGEIYERSY